MVAALSGMRQERVSLDHPDKVMMVVRNQGLVTAMLVGEVALAVLVGMEMV